MYFLCDESGAFDLQINPSKEWRNAVVGGILIGYKARCWWRKNCFKYPKKATDFIPSQMITVLDSLIDCKAIGKCHVIHLTVDLDEAKQCQDDLILPLFNEGDRQPKGLKFSFYDHLKRFQEMKPQTFVKVWTLLRLMTEGVFSYLSCVGKRRSQDQRGLNIIIDDQPEQTLPILEDFIWFFLHSFVVNGTFASSSGIPKSMERYSHLDGQNQGVDLMSIINIRVGKQGEKLDDKCPELRLADIICNFMNRGFKGELPENVCSLLKKVCDLHPVYFGNGPGISANIPPSARPGVTSLGLTSQPDHVRSKIRKLY